MITIPTTANINAVDTSGSTLNTLNVDLRQQPNAGGFFEADVTTTAVSNGSAAVPGYISAIDDPTGAGNVAINIDFRQQANEGGFLEVRVSSALISCGVAAAPAAPTLGTASSGSQASRTEVFAVSYVDANGNETLASATASETVGANLVATVTSPSAATNAVKYNVYGAVGAGTLTLQNASPITLGTGYQEPASGLTTTGRVVPTNATLVVGPCTVTVAAGPPLAQGAATLTITQ